MANDARRVSDLVITTTLLSNDRVVVLANTVGNTQTKTITLNNLGIALSNNLPTANSTQLGVVKAGNNITINASGVISTPGIPTTNIESVGYVLSTNSSGGVSWQQFGGVYNVVTIDTQGVNAYTVTSNDSVILVNPAVVGSDVTITFPIATAIEGKEILVKLIDASTNHKVIITTDDPNNAYLEDPVTGAFDLNYNLVDTGQAETWIHDGNVYRHLNTARATPVFYTNANTYAQVVVKNASNGENASSDLVLYNNLGDEAAGIGPLIDIGINSSQYSNSIYSIGVHNDAYLFTDNGGYQGGNLAIGVAQDSSIVFHANGTTIDKKVMVVNSTAVTLSTILQTPQSTKANSSIGTVGQICWDSNYIYVCTNTNTWKRATLDIF